MASSRYFRVFLIAVALFISFSAILASLRFGARAPSILQHLRPSRPALHIPAQRPLTNSTMAPAQYKTPPQLPPKFTATPSSLIADTKRLVCMPAPACERRAALPARRLQRETVLTVPRSTGHEASRMAS